MNIYDSHTHLNQDTLFPEWKEHISSFIELWGKGLVNAWANESYNTNWLEIAKTCETLFPNFYTKCALGYHPCDTENVKGGLEKGIEDLKNQILENKKYVVAIGECWIDLHYEDAPCLEEQQQYFKAQCELARELNVPIMIHSRDAFNETFEILKKFTDITVYIHCRGYWKEEIKKMIETFPQLYIGFCWNITYKSAENLRESIKELPLKKLLIETDAPYLSPQGRRWEPNTPKNVKVIGEYIAALLWIPEEKLWEQVEKNFFNLYEN